MKTEVGNQIYQINTDIDLLEKKSLKALEDSEKQMNETKIDKTMDKTKKAFNVLSSAMKGDFNVTTLSGCTEVRDMRETKGSLYQNNDWNLGWDSIGFQENQMRSDGFEID